jgi:hypothetical protein
MTKNLGKIGVTIEENKKTSEPRPSTASRGGFGLAALGAAASSWHGAHRGPDATAKIRTPTLFPVVTPNAAVEGSRAPPRTTTTINAAASSRRAALTVALTRPRKFARRHFSSPILTQPHGAVRHHPPWPPSRRFLAQTPPRL